jgi:Trk-type K+ transport system membrane component
VLHTNVPLEESTADKLLQMFFTSISTRTAGFNCIDLSILNCGILVLQVPFWRPRPPS